jgi:hypothetical protein
LDIEFPSHLKRMKGLLLLDEKWVVDEDGSHGVTFHPHKLKSYKVAK